jgi:hypothetical protein
MGNGGAGCRIEASFAKDCVMKMTTFRWRWAMPLAAALAWNAPAAEAQQPFSAVDLIKPIEAAPIEAAPTEGSPFAGRSAGIGPHRSHTAVETCRRIHVDA